jgi:hypothetical protein
LQQTESGVIIEDDKVFATIEEALAYLQQSLITPTPSATVEPTPTPSETPPPTPTVSVTPTVTPTISVTPTITPTISTTPTITPTPSQTPTLPFFGDKTAGLAQIPTDNNQALVSRFTLSNTISIQRFFVYFTSGSAGTTSAKVIVHNENSGNPAVLVGLSQASNVPSGGGWVEFTYTGTLTPGDYFMGVVSNGSGDFIGCDSDAPPYSSRLSSNTSYNNPQSSWGADTELTNVRVNIYAEYS